MDKEKLGEKKRKYTHGKSISVYEKRIVKTGGSRDIVVACGSGG